MNAKGWFRGFLLPERIQQGLIPQTYVKVIHAGDGKQCNKCGFFEKDAFCGKCGNKMIQEEISEMEELNDEEEEGGLKECSECKLPGEGSFCSNCGGKMIRKEINYSNLITEVISKDQMSILTKMITKIKSGLIDTTTVNFKICSSGTLGVKLEDEELVDLVLSGKLQNTTNLSLYGCRRLTSNSIKELGKLKNLKTLNLGITKDPNDFSNFGDVPLKSIFFIKSGVSDEGISSLANNCKNLTEIDLTNSFKLTSNALKEFQNFKSLAKLKLNKCAIDDSSLKNLANLQLQHLNLTECEKISNQGIKFLSSIISLTKLNLSKNPLLTGDALQSLANLKNLIYLDFSGIKNVQDASLKHISLLSIQNLFLNNTNFGTLGLGLICKLAKTLVNLDIGVKIFLPFFFLPFFFTFFFYLFFFYLFFFPVFW